MSDRLRRRPSARSGTAPEPDGRLVAACHARTKHGFQGFARRPETLDRDAEPNPLREFAGARRTALAVNADRLDADFAASREPEAVAPLPLNVASVGALLELSVGLSAWKELGPDRWALRCNPSSGNLHPTETYVVSRGVAGLGDGLHHYISRDTPWNSGVATSRPRAPRPGSGSDCRPCTGARRGSMASARSAPANSTSATRSAGAPGSWRPSPPPNSQLSSALIAPTIFPRLTRGRGDADRDQNIVHFRDV